MTGRTIVSNTDFSDQATASAIVRERRFQRAMRLTMLEPLSSISKVTELSAPETTKDTRLYASSREPCRRCGIRGDLSYSHQRPLSALHGVINARTTN